MLQDSWDMLLKALNNNGHPLQWPVVGTADEKGRGSQLRTVVLRGVDIAERKLLFFTDVRSNKILELQADPCISFLFYDPVERFQIRARGMANLYVRDEVARRYWSEIDLEGRKNYASIPRPGAPSEHSTFGLPPFWRDDMPLSETEYTFRNFVAVSCLIDEVDCLQLHRKGHQRSHFDWNAETGEWAGGWLVA